MNRGIKGEGDGVTQSPFIGLRVPGSTLSDNDPFSGMKHVILNGHVYRNKNLIKLVKSGSQMQIWSEFLHPSSLNV